MNRSESKYFATAAKMDDALLELLETKDFAYITVKEICAKAGVNRSTFYLHYETVGDLLDESIDRMNRQFLKHMNIDSGTFIEKLESCAPDDLFLITPHYLEPYLEYIRAHKRLFKTMMEKGSSLGLHTTYESLSRYVISPILQRFNVPSADRPYLMAFYLRGLMAIIAEWLKTDCTDSIDHVVSIMQKCVAKPSQAQ